MKSLTFSLFFLALFSVSTEASDFHSPRSAALGGAGHAGPLLNDAIYLNPSFTSFLPTYSISASFLLFSGPPVKTPLGDADYHGRYYNLSVQDGRTELFQAGVGYTVRENFNTLHIGASKSFIKKLGFGAGMKFFFPHKEGTSGAQDITLSTTWATTGWLQLALVADNMLQTERSKSFGLYREILIGSKINIMGIVMLYFDPHYTPDLPDSSLRFGHELGLEVTLLSDIFFRLGNFRNAKVPFQAGAHGRGYGIGIGWVAPKISLDYGISRVIESYEGLPRATAHTFGATVFF